HRRLFRLSPFPLAGTAFRLGDIGSHFPLRQIPNHLVAVVSLVRDHFLHARKVCYANSVFGNAVDGYTSTLADSGKCRKSWCLWVSGYGACERNGAIPRKLLPTRPAFIVRGWEQ